MLLRKILLSVLGIAFIIGSVMYAKHLIANKNKPKPQFEKVVKNVFAEEVTNGDIPIVIPANGNLVAKRRLELYAEVQGLFKIGNKEFKPGTVYRQGETLINIDADEYYASVQAAKSNLYNDIAAIMPDLRLDFPEVYQKWLNYLSGFDIQKTTPKLPEMTSEKENYFITGRGIVTGYYNVKNMEQRLVKYRIVAPYTGILTEALVTEGTLIRSGQKLGEFIDPSVYEMQVAITKTFSNLLEVGKKVQLNTLDKSKTYEGVVSRVNGSIDAATQTITAFIEVKHPELKEGMYLEANLDAKTESNAIEIRRSLLLESNEIFVVRDSVLDLIPVKPVFFSEKTVVLKDVPDGTIILSRQVPGAYAGMLVKPASQSESE
ncbi:HlyD family efflux transporter periplasmic adaptor subunit [Paucihalobacter ruber]|uniref:HlyD family efflux transporter periplasmic adaptor subunit n=1 Tax=Paucihalobacter ruber TaxID=2567861 RepID=A0A506PPW5_9FLAO|nr:HlyD family efflux transporter periplasmic adaptor subunit [Paucihalobacter ruber]TPV35619.1 HlyD family efflux transporter periplasmic adaptor subunit [Paucihalobacter ruber]